MTTLPSAAPVLSRNAGIVVLVLAVVTVAICWLIPAANASDETGVILDLPRDISGLEGVPIPVSQAEHEILPPDTEFAKMAYGPFLISEKDLFHRFVCQIVLSGREKRSIHRPERCLPGQGWTVIDSQIVDVPLASGHKLQATALLLRRPYTMPDGSVRTMKQYFLYWYVGRKIDTPYSFVRVLLTNWDLVVHRFNQRWAYVICAAYVTDGFDKPGRTQAQTLDQLKQFIRLAAPTFMKSEMPNGGV